MVAAMAQWGREEIAERVAACRFSLIGPPAAPFIYSACGIVRYCGRYPLEGDRSPWLAEFVHVLGREDFSPQTVRGFRLGDRSELLV